MEAFTIDIEDYYSLVVRDRLGIQVPVSTHVDGEVLRLLDFVDRLGVKATCFVVGKVAEERPHIVRELIARGHEIASHSYRHLLMHQLTPVAFAEDLRRSKEVLEQITGEKVRGFRAPAFSLREGQYWAFEIMAMHGIEYDSSVRLVWPGGRRPAKALIDLAARSGVKEYPGIALGWGRLRVPLAGGGGIRLIPEWITRLGLELVGKDGYSTPTYIHPYDLVENPEYDWPKADIRRRIRLAWFNFGQRRGRSKVEDRLSRLLGGLTRLDKSPMEYSMNGTE
jgi:polysaccharide deacetylase family protein (PEP-CTERM system associated)